jgi:uncharacterized SAM-binding protein YcdF (DUF218 family)
LSSATKEWLRLAASAPVRRRALRYVVVVGTILITINHGDAILRGDVDGARVARILLTLVVPYVVSTVSSVAAMREMRKKDGA